MGHLRHEGLLADWPAGFVVRSLQFDKVFNLVGCDDQSESEVSVLLPKNLSFDGHLHMTETLNVSTSVHCLWLSIRLSRRVTLVSTASSEKARKNTGAKRRKCFRYDFLTILLRNTPPQRDDAQKGRRG